jgi:nitrite reductase (NADH) large subunit
MSGKERLVVIGNGMAGARFVEDLLARGGGERWSVSMFGDEPHGNYNRILLSGVLAGKNAADDIVLNPLDWYRERSIRLHAGVRAARIDLDARVVHGAGVAEPYDALVVATGSSPFVPPLEGARDEGGALRDGVFVFRTLEDCRAITARAARSKRAAVIGGGLLGLEAARGLLLQGLEVHVVHLAPHLMELQLDQPGARILQRALERMGLHVHLGKSTKAVLGDGQGEVRGLRFEDGGTLDADMVVISAGIRPNVALAREAGLLVERGIVVGDDLRCAGREREFALGECAQHRGKTYGLVAPLWEQAQVLADRLSGRAPRAAYAGSKVATKLKVMGVDLAVMGAKEPGQDDEEVLYVDAARGIYKKLVLREGRLQGAILLGDAGAAPDLFRAFDREAELPPDPARLLFPGEGAEPKGVLDLPDEAQVCNCNGVSKGRILEAVRGGRRTLAAVCEATRAGTGCGSCKRDVGALLEAAGGGAGAADDPSIHYYVPGVPLPKPELVRAVKEFGLKSVSAVFQTLAGGREHAPSKPGLASLLRVIWGAEYRDERDARFVNDRVHANIQKDGTFSVVPRIFGGVTSPAQLRRIADVAERHRVPMVKITGGQRIDLLGVPREELPAVWRELGEPSGHAYAKAFRTCKTCVGTDFCRYGVGDSTALGIAIERRYQGLESPHKMKLATAGCPRNCSEATTKDVGAVAIEGGRWELYVGGAAGSRVRKGDLLCVVESHEEVLRLMGRFMQHYREQAKYLERTYDFVERVGIEKVRAVVVRDEEGQAARLDAAVEAAVAAQADPWREAAAPVHPSQFRGELPVLPRDPDALIRPAMEAARAVEGA